MKVVAIIQARMSSERLPGKVLKNLNGTPLIQCIYMRAKNTKSINQVIVATSEDSSDNELFDFCRLNKMEVFRGDLNNVLKRYYECATKLNADIVIRLTGDNPLIDSIILDSAVSKFQELKVDYLRYCEQLPIGMHVEVFSYGALKRAYFETNNKECQEHVTLYIYRNTDKFESVVYSDECIEDKSYLRWTVDTEKDYELVKCIYENFDNDSFTYQEVLELFKRKPELELINNDVEQRVTKYKLKT